MIKLTIRKQFKCDKEKLWNIITSNENYSWRSDLFKIDIINEKHFIEYTKNNYQTYFKITSNKKLLEYKLDFENSNLKGKWIGKFKEPSKGIIELEFAEEIEVKKLILKLLAKTYLRKQQKRYMIDLEREINKCR